MIKENYIQTTVVPGERLESVVKALQHYHAQGEKVCAEFNGHVLYSDTVTMDSAYLEVYGQTKADFDKSLEEQRENYRRAEEEHKAKIPDLTQEWREKGRSVLDPKYWVEWARIVPIRLNDLYHGMELGACLDIVKALNDGCTMDEAERIIDGQNHSGMSFSLVKTMVKHFCDRGGEFSDFIDKPSLDEKITDAKNQSGGSTNNDKDKADKVMD